MTNHKTADQYDDPKFNYQIYWEGRDYEHRAEEIALKRLLGGKHVATALDIGGGYGRLSRLLTDYASEVILAEPSQQQLDMAKEYLKKHPKVKLRQMQADDLKLNPRSVDLAIMVRVMHHLPDPTAEFNEIAKILKPKGLLVLEVANYSHARNRIKYYLKGEKLPEEPVDIRSEPNKKKSEIPFVNHNPKTVIKQLAQAGFKVEKALSVSNLRSPRLKRIVPTALMLSVERLLQPTLAHTYFGPSVFFLVRKVS